MEDFTKLASERTACVPAWILHAAAARMSFERSAVDEPDGGGGGGSTKCTETALPQKSSGTISPASLLAAPLARRRSTA